MKIIKLQKKDYHDLVFLLKRLGLVSGNRAYPERLVVNETTYKKMKTAYAEKLKEVGFISKKNLQYSVEMEFLNLGPVVLKTKNNGNALQTGYAILLNPKERE